MKTADGHEIEVGGEYFWDQESSYAFIVDELVTLDGIAGEYVKGKMKVWGRELFCDIKNVYKSQLLAVRENLEVLRADVESLCRLEIELMEQG